MVGNARLLRERVARPRPGFVSASTFLLARLNCYPGEVAELGRLCIHPQYRNSIVMSLLWRGVASYIVERRIGLLFGRTGFPGTHTRGREHALSFLHHFRLAGPRVRARANNDQLVNMDLIPASSVSVIQALRQMPELLKGYLRLGCVVGEGAVINNELNQLDVCVILEVERLVREYYSRDFTDKGIERNCSLHGQAA